MILVWPAVVRVSLGVKHTVTHQKWMVFRYINQIKTKLNKLMRWKVSDVKLYTLFIPEYCLSQQQQKNSHTHYMINVCPIFTAFRDITFVYLCVCAWKHNRCGEIKHSKSKFQRNNLMDNICLTIVATDALTHTFLTIMLPSVVIMVKWCSIRLMNAISVVST